MARSDRICWTNKGAGRRQSKGKIERAVYDASLRVSRGRNTVAESSSKRVARLDFFSPLLFLFLSFFFFLFSFLLRLARVKMARRVDLRPRSRGSTFRHSMTTSNCNKVAGAEAGPNYGGGLTWRNNVRDFNLADVPSDMIHARVCVSCAYLNMCVCVCVCVCVCMYVRVYVFRYVHACDSRTRNDGERK